MYPYLDYYNNIKYKNLTDKAYDILEEMIVTMFLKPNEIYSELEISNYMNIGRTPVREAIKKLESTHLVSIIPRSGIMISPIRLEECILQTEVRSMLEKLVLVRAAKFSILEEKETFIKLSKEYKQAVQDNDVLSILRVDNEFNQYSADCARNVFAKSALIPLHSMARRLFFKLYDTDKKLIEDINNAHVDIILSIASANEADTLKHTNHLIHLINDLTVSFMSSLTIENMHE